ncbi:ribosome-associated translation inhibitor RaiA, partial [bacterium]
VNITFRHTEPSDDLKGYVNEKLLKLKKYFDGATESHVILSQEKIRHMAEIVMNAGGLRLNAKYECADFHSAIDGVFAKLDRQLVRHKEKIKGHGGKAAAREKQPIRESVYDYESFEHSAGPKILKTEHYETHPKTIDEAVMEIDLTDKNFLVFTGDDGKVKVVYRRDDGDYGLIEPQ